MQLKIKKSFIVLKITNTSCSYCFQKKCSKLITRKREEILLAIECKLLII